VADWTIRTAGEADADALALIGAATFLETFAGILPGVAIVAHCARVHSADAYRRLIGAGARAWLVEVAPGGAPVGYGLVATPELALAGPGDVELKRIYTLSRFHGAGIGPALMERAVEAARGSERLLLGVYVGNTRARSFYAKHGFEPIGERHFDVGGVPCDDLVMARSLAA
jgi:ribosomal protein S18 acetylase RimI-like enzyme